MLFFYDVCSNNIIIQEEFFSKKASHVNNNKTKAIRRIYKNKLKKLIISKIIAKIKNSFNMSTTHIICLLALITPLSLCYQNLSFTIPVNQHHIISEFNASDHAQFINHSCAFSTQNHTILRVTADSHTYINGRPLQGDVELQISSGSVRYFFDVTAQQNQTPSLVFQNLGNEEIQVICLLFRGFDYFIGKGQVTVIQDQESSHYPLQCRLFTIGQNVPVEFQYSDGSIWVAGGQATGIKPVNGLDFVYVVEGNSHYYQLKNAGDVDVDLLCQNFFG